MKILLALVSALLTVSLRAAPDPLDPHRTDINPALIYWQAMLHLPQLKDEDREYLSTNEWWAMPLDARFKETVVRYNVAMRVVEQGAAQTAPCDWGNDFTYGPGLFLPGLAKAKAIAQAARWRVRWHLESGNPDKARDELLAAFTLARHVGSDAILIGCLVDIAMENIVVNAIAENWFRLSPQTIQQLAAGLDQAPPRVPIAQVIATERIGFRDWLVRRVGLIQTASKDPAKVDELLRTLLEETFEESAEQGKPKEPSEAKLSERIYKASGGTCAGVIRYTKELDSDYDEATAILKLPFGEFLPQIKSFSAKIESGENLLAKEMLPNFEKARFKELAADVRIAQLRAASEYLSHGEAGLKKVVDPLNGQAFKFRKITVNGVHRGFELASAASMGGLPLSIIFVERDGPAFHLTGSKAGRLIQ